MPFFYIVLTSLLRKVSGWNLHNQENIVLNVFQSGMRSRNEEVHFIPGQERSKLSQTTGVRSPRVLQWLTFLPSLASTFLPFFILSHCCSLCPPNWLFASVLVVDSNGEAAAAHLAPNYLEPPSSGVCRKGGVCLPGQYWRGERRPITSLIDIRAR